MTIRWCPDTCGCVINVAHDWSAVESFETKCPVHASMDDLTAHKSLHADNIFKNCAISHAVETVPEITGSHFVYDDQGLKILAPVNGDDAKLQELQSSVDAEFGEGTIRVVHA